MANRISAAGQRTRPCRTIDHSQLAANQDPRNSIQHRIVIQSRLRLSRQLRVRLTCLSRALHSPLPSLSSPHLHPSISSHSPRNDVPSGSSSRLCDGLRGCKPVLSESIENPRHRKWFCWRFVYSTVSSIPLWGRKIEYP